MTRLGIAVVTGATVLSLLGNYPAHAAVPDPVAARVHSTDPQIIAVLGYALERSPSFYDLVATLDHLKRPVAVERGDCLHRRIRACLEVRPGQDLLVRVDPEQPIATVVAQLAHALYHAAEIPEDSKVTDEASLRAFYDRAAAHSCVTPADQCWETQAAVTFEALVARQLTQDPTE